MVEKTTFRPRMQVPLIDEIAALPPDTRPGQLVYRGPEPRDDLDLQLEASLGALTKERREHRKRGEQLVELELSVTSLRAELSAEKRAHQDTRDELARERLLTDRWQTEAIKHQTAVASVGKALLNSLPKEEST